MRREGWLTKWSYVNELKLHHTTGIKKWNFPEHSILFFWCLTHLGPPQFECVCTLYITIICWMTQSSINNVTVYQGIMPFRCYSTIWQHQPHQCVPVVWKIEAASGRSTIIPNKLIHLVINKGVMNCTNFFKPEFKSIVLAGIGGNFIFRQSKSP